MLLPRVLSTDTANHTHFIGEQLQNMDRHDGSVEGESHAVNLKV